MRIDFRLLRAGETDHELLWSLVGLAVAALAVVWVAAGSPGEVVCPLRAVTGLPCPTCGSTRALAALLEGRLADAARLNPLAFSLAVGFPMYAVYGLAVSATSLRRVRIRLDPAQRALIRAVVVAVCGVAWLFLLIDGR